MAETHPPRRPPRHMAKAVANTRMHYLIFGLGIGGLWLLNLNLPLLEHGLQMLAVMTALTVLQILLDRHRGKTPPYARLIVGKLTLLAVAVGAEWLLAPLTSHSNLIVAVGLAVLAATAGPRLEARMAHHTTPTDGPNRAGVSAEPGAPGDIRTGLPVSETQNP